MRTALSFSTAAEEIREAYHSRRGLPIFNDITSFQGGNFHEAYNNVNKLFGNLCNHVPGRDRNSRRGANKNRVQHCDFAHLDFNCFCKISS